MISCKEESNLNYERFNLKGKVKSFKETIFLTDPIDDTRQRGEIVASTEYFFDEKGYNIKDNQFFGNSELFSWSQFTYDRGNLIREDNFDKDGKLMYTTTFNKISEEEIEYERTLNTGEKVMSGKNYVKNNKILKSVLTMFNKTVEYEVITIELEYNTNGNMSLRTQSKKNGESETINYHYTEFDPKGNWTKCTTYGKEGELEPYNFLTREYIYF
jgi:hypothetical protein